MIDQDEMKAQAQQHFKTKVLVVDDADRHIFELLTNVPKIDKPVAIFCAVLNFLLPGFGTLVATCSANDNVSKSQMGMALLQFLTAFFLVGFVLAAYWSYLLVEKAWERENFRSPGASPYNSGRARNGQYS